MSRVYFHSPSGTAELRGSERAWLSRLARGPATSAWDVTAHIDLERAVALCALIDEVPDGAHGANYLHTYLRDALAEDRHNEAQVAAHGWHAARTVYEARRRFVDTLAMRLCRPGLAGTWLTIAGHRLDAENIGLNTALVAGGPPVALAAKIDGWCEVHPFIAGPDRGWAADIIDGALTAGLYRRTVDYADHGPVPLGWDDVLQLLRARDDEPVVLSYSVTDLFPARAIADWQPPALPDTWAPAWADTDTGRAEWAAYTPQEQAAARTAAALDTWYELPDADRWAAAMAGLTARRPWARLAPDTLATVGFGPFVTVYDVLAPDRDARIAAAAADA